MVDQLSRIDLKGCMELKTGLGGMLRYRIRDDFDVVVLRPLEGDVSD